MELKALSVLSHRKLQSSDNVICTQLTTLLNGVHGCTRPMTVAIPQTYYPQHFSESQRKTEIFTMINFVIILSEVKLHNLKG